MKDRKQGRISLRTTLLMLAVTLMIFSLFVVLPIQLPPASSMDTMFDKMFWSCTFWGSNPVRYFTWTWDTDEEPTETDWVNLLKEAKFYEFFKCEAMKEATYTEPNPGIVQNLHRIRPRDGFGKLHYEVNPENENQLIISGYLQFGIFKVDDVTIESLEGQYSNEEFFLFDISELLRIAPPPTKHGVVRNFPVGIVLTNFFGSDSKTTSYSTQTDGNGYFSCVLEPDTNALYYEITVANGKNEIASKGRGSPPVTYEGNSVFYSSHLNCRTLDWNPEKEKTKQRAWIFAGIVLAGAAFLITWYLWHRKHTMLFEYEEEDTKTEKDMFEEIETLPGGDTDRIEIRFPQIEEDLADVWSSNDLFIVHFRLKDSERNHVPDSECHITWGDGQTERSLSDNEGEVRNSHIFTDNDEYIISGSYTDSETHREVSSWRIIRIVDYREEMVRLFNRMLGTLNIDIITIDKRMTAREIKQVLEPKLEEIPSATIDVIVEGFEEANYSIHSISRDSYTRMYRAVKKVIDFGQRERKSEQDTTE